VIAEALELGRRLPVLRASAERLRALQLRKLRATLQAVYHTVPYYRELFDSAGFAPSDVRSLADLAHVPVTTKRDLLDAGVQRIVRRGTDVAACSSLTTSGSSGEPWTVYMDRRDVVTRNVLQFRALVTTGIRPWDRLVVLGPMRWSAGGLHQRLGLWRREHVSPSIAVSDQIERLRSLRPDVLWIYPSFLSAILDAVDGRLSDVCRPHTIVTTAEVLDPQAFAALHRDFAFEHFDFYGSIEAGRIAWECRAHEGAHVNADVVYLELIDSGVDYD
jgi:phenylacetate-CoA ligase